MRLRFGDAVAGLLTSINTSVARVSMHGVRVEILEAQAAATGLPLRTIPLPDPCSNEIYEQRLGAAVAAARADGFTHVAFGDLFLEDIREYREDRLRGTGLTPLFPLWGLATDVLARDMVAAGVRAVLTCVDTNVMPRRFAGMQFGDALADLPPAVDPCGERGEFHSCVTAGPMFSGSLDVDPGPLVDRGQFVFADLLLAR
jgi:diphthamide synthase (EF-2-diphthine--ammonia ligase)